MSQFIIDITYDSEHGIYLGSCKDVRGLHVEGKSIEAILEVVHDVLPEMVADNLAYDLKNGHFPLYNIATFAETRVQ